MSIASTTSLQLPELRVCRSSGLRKKAYFGKSIGDHHSLKHIRYHNRLLATGANRDNPQPRAN